MPTRNLMLVHPVKENTYLFHGRAAMPPQVYNSANPQDIFILRFKGDREESRRAHSFPDQLSHPFLRFINARALPDMLIGLDECFGVHDGGFLDDETTALATDLALTEDGQSLDSLANETVHSMFQSIDDVEGIAEIFYHRRNPTRAQREDVEDALRCWGATPFELQRHADRNRGYTVWINSLNDLVDAKEDLYNHALALAYYMGKVEKSAVLDDKGNFLFPRITGDPRRCYRENNEKNPFVLPDLDLFYSDYLNGEKKPHFEKDAPLYDSSLHIQQRDLPEPEALYLEGIFNNLSPQGQGHLLHIDGHGGGYKVSLNNVPLHACLLSQMWGFIRNGMCKEQGIGSIQVCPKCKRLFLQTASSKRKYCSRSCNSGAAQQRSKEQSAESKR